MPTWPGNDDAAWDAMTAEDWRRAHADLEANRPIDGKSRDAYIAGFRRELAAFVDRLGGYRRRLQTDDYDFLDSRLYEANQHIADAIEALRVCEGYRSIKRDGAAGSVGNGAP